MQQEGIFSDYAQEFYEYGLQPIPTAPLKKACLVKGYNKVFYEKRLTQEVLDEWIGKYGHWDIGIVCGKLSGVIGIDFDFEGFKDSAKLEAMLIGGLPETPAIKRGKKGWTRFYKYNQLFSETKSLKRFVPEKNKDETFIDILSNKRITVMPPSRHSEGIDYEWVGTKHLIDCLDELPELTAEDLAHIEMVHNFEVNDTPETQTDQAKIEARHDKVFGHIMRQSNVCADFDTLVAEVLAFDRRENGRDKKGPYFEDKKNIKNQTPQEAAKQFVDKVCTWKENKLKDKGVDWRIGKTSSNYWKNVGDEEKPKWKRSSDQGDYIKFFNLTFPSARKDFFTGVVFHRDNMAKEWTPIENNIGVVRSKALEVGLDKNNAQDALQRWYETLAPKPLFDLNSWDGRDYIAEMVKHIEWEDMDDEIAIDLFKDWMAGIFRRMRNPKEANKMLILRGEQGIGKDRWINHLLGALGHNHGTISLEPRKKVENFIALDGLVTGFIPEFDETVEVPIAMLKTLITSESAVYRRPYDRIATNRPLRYSLISSVNFDDIMRDPTGNRRFVIMDAVKINWDYTKTIPMQKIIDQANALAEKGYSTGDVALAAVKAKLEEEAPADTEALFMEEVAALLKDRQNTLRTLLTKSSLTHNEKEILEDGCKIRWPMIAENVEKIAKKYGFRTNRCQRTIKRYGFSDRNKSSTFYFVPASYAKEDNSDINISINH